MTRKLKNLVAEWHEERGFFQRVSIRYMASAKILSKLNVEIYNQCRIEGVEINKLDLNK